MKISTKEIVATSLLTAIAIIIPIIMPPFMKVILPPFTATFASHVPLIIAMFISPFAAVFTALGSAAGFLIALGPIVAARAAMHVFFTVTGVYMIRRKQNIFLVILVTMVIHTLSDMLIVYILYAAGAMSIDKVMATVQTTIAIGTSIHHIVDFAIALAICVPLSKSTKLINMDIIKSR